jgi:predicted ATPase/DNA-binding XRE family transcriptional regulator
VQRATRSAHTTVTPRPHLHSSVAPVSMPAPVVSAPSFAEALRQQRLARGLTQEELAQRARLSVRAISDLERGLKQPRPSTARLLARGLGLPAGEAAALRATAQGRGVVTGQRNWPDHKLPTPLSSFVGRGPVIAELEQLLREPQIRLLTLTGAGGVGKTRLAIEVAARVQQRYPDGAWLVEFAGVTDPGLVPHVTAASLGVVAPPGQPPLAALRGAFAHARLLLVLDNCEHVLDACAYMAADLLPSCPDLQILATSREPLRLVGETAWLVPSLALPTPELEAPAQPSAVDSEAGRPFVERASAVNRALVWDAPTAVAVAEVCRRLDGIPLAIELAAAWAQVLAVPEIAQRLAAGPGLLVAPRGAATRHKSLRATVDWSLDLLSGAERRLFEQVSVFAGGFTLVAAGAIAGGDVLAPLAHLVAASLVLAEPRAVGGVRYRLLEPVRAVARERLEALASPLPEATREAHAQYFLGLAESVQDSLWGRGTRGAGVRPAGGRDRQSPRGAALAHRHR